MPDPMRIRAQAQPNGTVVRVLMSDEMEAGQRKDATGKAIPAWRITEVSAAPNGKTVLTAPGGTAIAKNPCTRFTVRGATAGDTITVSGLDDRGERRTHEATVA